MRKLRVFSMVALIATALTTTVTAETSDDNAWLQGTWWYAASNGSIVEGSRKDGMVFKSDRTVDLINASRKPYRTCSYRLRSSRVLLLGCMVNGQRRDALFNVSSDRTRLANSQDTDYGFYRRAR